MAESRRLAAILFTDVVGYTALMEADEERAIRVRDRHRALLRPLVEQFEGELIEASGDEALAAFPSSLLAVDCAIAIQAALRATGDLKLRIGIHVGDVLFRDGEVIGEGVNVAARIRPLAEPGGICVSGPVYEQVKNHEHVFGRSLGPQTLKNVERPVEVFALGAGSRPAAAPARGARRLRWAVAVGLLLVALGFTFSGSVVKATAFLLTRFAPVGYEQDVSFTTTSDGVRIAWASVGHGPPIVVVPGWVSHIERGTHIDLTTPALMETHRVVRYDGRGFGLSDREIVDHGLEGKVRDLEAVVDAAGLDRFGILAISAGGPTAVTYAARHPERVTRLMLFGTFARLIDSDEARAKVDALVSAARVGWASDNPAFRTLFTGIFFPEAGELQVQVLNELLRAGAEPESAARFLEALGELDVRDTARTLDVPTLVAHVEKEQAVPFVRGRELASLIPGATLVPIPGTNHIPLGGEGQEAYLERLRDWFARDLAAAPTP